MRSSIPLLLLVLATALPGAAHAQQKTLAEMPEIPTGDMNYRSWTYVAYAATQAPYFAMIPGDGLSGATFRERPNGEPSWGRMAQQRGFNVFMLDRVGCGKAPEPPDRNLTRILETGLFGVYQVGFATKAGLMIAHADAAGMAVRARSFDPDVAASMVLIDPIGPQGAQPMTDLTPREVLERLRDPDHPWVTWGLGPEHGVLREGLDLTPAEAESLVANHEDDQPAYWAGLLTDMDSDYRVREPMHLDDLPVLVIRTPAADAAQIEREDHVVRWMTERGMRVDRLDLSSHPTLKDTSGLPWAGDLADEVFEEIWTWYHALEGVPVQAGR
jgi:hypothetical protein